MNSTMQTDVVHVAPDLEVDLVRVARLCERYVRLATSHNTTLIYLGRGFFIKKTGEARQIVCLPSSPTIADELVRVNIDDPRDDAEANAFQLSLLDHFASIIVDGRKIACRKSDQGLVILRGQER